MGLYYFISTAGSTGKSVPGVKTKVIVKEEDDALKTPMLDGGFSPEIGEVRVLMYIYTYVLYLVRVWLM